MPPKKIILPKKITFVSRKNDSDEAESSDDDHGPPSPPPRKLSLQKPSAPAPKKMIAPKSPPKSVPQNNTSVKPKIIQPSNRPRPTSPIRSTRDLFSEKSPEKSQEKSPIKIMVKSPKKGLLLPKKANIIKSPGKEKKALVLRKKEQKIELMPHQVKWASRILNEILQVSKIYFDTSETRTGKSYLATYVGQTLKLSFFVVCPATVISVWQNLFDQYNLPYHEIITYESLTGKVNNNLKHDWLNRVIDDKLTFHASREYLDLVEQGIMLIIDEGHMIKNNSKRFHSCNALMKPIRESDNNSIIAILTHTSMTKASSAVQFLNLSGHLEDQKLYTYKKQVGIYNFKPVKNLIAACEKIDADKTEKITATPLNKKNCEQIVAELFLEIINPMISGSAPKPSISAEKIENGIFLDIGNGFYEFVDQIKANKLDKAISDLEKTKEFVTSQNKKLGRGQIKHLMSNIEVAKVGIFSRIAYKILQSDPNAKVILALNYTQPRRDLVNIFKNYNPIVIGGETKQAQRGELIKAFQTDPSRRLLIGNTHVIGFGVSLHDTVGDSPRYLLIASDYMVTRIHQCAGRINPIDLKSKATVRIVYGKNTGEREQKILDTMRDDSVTLRRTLVAENSTNIILPGEYKNYYDEEFGDVDCDDFDQNDVEEGEQIEIIDTEEDDGIEHDTQSVEYESD